MLSIYGDQYMEILSLALGSILHASSMLRARKLGFTELFRIVFPASIIHGSCALDSTFRFSRCVYCYCLILGIGALLLDSVWAVDNIKEGTWSPGFIVDMLSYILAYVMWTVMAIELVRQKEGFEQVIRELEKVDAFLQNPTYDATFYLIAFILAVVVNLIEKVICGIEYESIMQGLGYYLYMSPIVMFSSQYFFLMAVASDQFYYLTSQLRLTYKPWHFNDLITMHKSLCDTAKKINSIYSLHLLIITSIPFTINTLKIYSAIMCVIRPDTYDDSNLLTENIFHVLMNSIVFWCLVHSSSSVQEQMLSIYGDQYMEILSLALGSILHASSMLRARKLGFTELFRIVFPASIIHGSCALDSTFRFSRCVYCYCLILGIGALLLDSVWAVDNIKEGTWSPGFIVDMLSYILAYVMWTVMAIELVRQKEGFEQVIRELEKVDAFLQNPTYDATFYLIAFILAVVVNLIEKVICGIEYESIMQGLGYYLYMSPIVMFSSQYFFLMAVASDQFYYLTSQLRLTYKPWHFNDLITMHKSLCDTAKKINSIYSLHLLIITSIPFTINTLKIYSAIMCVIRPDTYDDSNLLTENIFHVLMNSIVFWCLVHSSSSVQEQARQFNIELLIILLNGNDIGNENYFQQYLSMDWNVKPTACGFYNIDYPLLTSTLTGYLTLNTYLLQLTGSTLK